jgi:sulfatase maturation enzyme AslB (radical SAM superfamily)
MTALDILYKKYSVIACQDISEYFDMPWSEFYLHLCSMKKSEYQDQERLVFYLRDLVDQKLLQNFFRDFYQQLKVIDIPNFFVILVVPGNRESDIIKQVHGEIKHDSNPVIIVDNKVDGDHWKPIEITKSKAAFGMPDTACPLPWNSLDISPVGTFAPCCFYQGSVTRENGTLFDPTVDTIEDVYNSQYMKKLRQLFREGVKLQSCSRCWKEEESGAVSKRQLYALRFGDDSRAINWEEDDVKNLKMLSVSFGNVCNFKCRICSEKSSSKIAGEILQQVPVPQRKSSPIWDAIEQGKWIRNSQPLWTSVSENSQIKYFDFAGGEPLLDKNHLNALKTMIERGIASDVSIHYNTNGSIINDELLETWQHFKKIDLAISIDDMGERFNIQRPGDKADWDLIAQNVKYIKANKTNNVILNLQCVISTMNVYYLPELCDWIDEIGFEDLHFSILYNPAHLSLLTIPKRAADLAVEKLRSHRFNSNTQPFIDTAVGLLERARQQENIPLVNYIKQLDDLRGEDFAAAHPEVASALGLV